MASALTELQEWYDSQCDDEWEHRYRISIGTLDNPGWCLCVYVEGTDLADAPFIEVKENYDDDLQCLVCAKHDSKFIGHGGPRQLERMIEIFLAWARKDRPPGAGEPVGYQSSPLDANGRFVFLGSTGSINIVAGEVNYDMGIQDDSAEGFRSWLQRASH